MADCPDCDAEIEPESFPFGDDVTCPRCGRVYKTDWDYLNEDDDRAWWITVPAHGAPSSDASTVVAESPSNLRMDRTPTQARASS